MKTKKIIELIIVSAITLSAVGLLTSKIVQNENKLNNNIFLSEPSSSTTESEINESTSSTESASSVESTIDYDANNLTAINRDTTNDWITSLAVPQSSLTSLKNGLLDIGTYSYIRNDLTFKKGMESRTDGSTWQHNDNDELVMEIPYDNINTHTMNYTELIKDIPGDNSYGYKNVIEEENNLSVGSLIVINKTYGENLFCGASSSLQDMLFNSLHFSEYFQGIDAFSDATFYYFYVSENIGEKSIFANGYLRTLEELTLDEQGGYLFDTMASSYEIDQNVQFYQITKNDSNQDCYHSIVIPE